jgi:RHS repeat-associated protein
LTAGRDAAGTLTTYFYDTAGNLFSFERGGQRYYVATDQLGTPKTVTDAVGSVVKIVEYDSWGIKLSDSNPAFDLSAGFAGGIPETTTGLVRFGFRDYEPGTGRWAAKDPIFFGGRQLNLYEYAGNNAVAFKDPSGTVLLPAVLAGGMIGGILNVTVTAFVNNGDITFEQGLGAFTGGFISGAVGTFAGPAGGTFALARFGAGATKSLAAKAATTVLAAGGNMLGQIAQNCVDPAHSSSVANAAAFGIGGGALGSMLPARGMSSLAQAAYFAPKNVLPYITTGAAGSASASGAFAASSNFFPGVPFGF